LWIGNIDPNTTSADLLAIYSHFGPIDSLRVLPDKECAFVNFVHVEDAVRAKDETEGSRVGSGIVRLGFGKSDTIIDTQGNQPTKSLCKLQFEQISRCVDSIEYINLGIGNIPPTTDPADLETLFSNFGSIESARVLVSLTISS
jgi:protein JSN1